MRAKKAARGGPRKGAGRPRGEPTVVLSMRITVSELERLRARCGPLSLAQYLRVALLLDPRRS